MVHHTHSDTTPSSAWASLGPSIAVLEAEGRVTRTFGRLDEKRQRAIVDAVLEESTERGPAAVNIKTVAARAGVSVGSLYQYFGDRERMLDFAVELCARYLVDFLARSRPYLLAMPLSEALYSYLSVGVEWGRTEANLVRFLGKAAYEGDPALAERAVRPVATAMRELTHAILARAAERGEVRCGDFEAAARLVNALTLALGDSQLLPYLNTYLQVTDEEVGPDRITEAFVEFVLKAVT
jgi:TetR/AcrR family transcriptional regulator